ncbi:hypothetical protein JT55_16765 [Rhodovulum sp. NI22]|nr:hypothetical protein JT55_16765 [Rhodovulum sp. NI22]
MLRPCGRGSPRRRQIAARADTERQQADPRINEADHQSREGGPAQRLEHEPSRLGEDGQTDPEQELLLYPS